MIQTMMLQVQFVKEGETKKLKKSL